MPGYIAKMWAHYSTMIEGPPIVHNIVHRVSKVYRKTIPTTLPYTANTAIVVPVNGTRTQCTTYLVLDSPYPRIWQHHPLVAN